MDKQIALPKTFLLLLECEFYCFLSMKASVDLIVLSFFSVCLSVPGSEQQTDPPGNSG